MNILRVVFIGALLLVSLMCIPPVGAQTQQARFTNVNYAIYPNPFLFTIPLLETGNISAGPLKVHPHFGIAQTYTDNVFRTDPTFGGRKADWYTTYAPGLQVQLPLLGRHRLVFDYSSNIESYSRKTSQNVDDQTIAGNVVLDFPGGLSIKGLGEIKTGHDYRGTATATALGSEEPNRFYTPNGGVEAEYAQRLFIRARYKYLEWQYIGPQAGSRDGSSIGDINTRNRVENFWALALGGRVAPKTYVFLEGKVSKHIYEINRELDSTTYNVGLGATWEVTGKTTGEVSIGWEGKNLDRASTRGSGTFSGLSFSGNILWAPQERTQVNLGFHRGTNETVLAGTRYFTSTGTSLNLSHAFTQKWRARARFSYNHIGYSDPITAEGKTQTRRDDSVTLGAGLQYQIQPWLGFLTTYSYAERLSNFLSNQYVASVWMVSAQAQF